MYRVLIVDDERIIREGMSSVIEWEAYGITVCGVAANGIEACEIIEEKMPHIVITDIKMPGMDGLELIEKLSKEHPGIIFIVLSGYGEFTFAKEAMRFGVKHYLLKPSDDEEIIRTIEEVLMELKEIEKSEEALKDIDNNFKKVLPQVGEQFFREFVTDGNFNEEELKYFLSLFELEEEKFKLVVLKTNKQGDLLDKYALKNIAYEIIKVENVYLSTIVEDSVLMLIKSFELNELTELLSEIKEYFEKYFKINISVGVSNENSFNNIRNMYQEVLECLKSEFYLGEGKIITEKTITLNEGELGFDINSEVFSSSIRTGNIENLNFQLDNFFQILKDSKLEIEIAKTYCIELFLILVLQGAPKETMNYARGIGNIEEMNTLEGIEKFIKLEANEIAKKNFEDNSKNYGSIINTVIKCIKENIQNPQLSLTWIAKEVLFMNENYLGKLFYKHTNEKFSQYVMKLRMEKAKELIKSEKDYKIYEITELTGLEDNTQYFSQVFKKYTGYTPSEYKKI
jgi:two-component system response regulator YesN